MDELVKIPQSAFQCNYTHNFPEAHGVARRTFDAYSADFFSFVEWNMLAGGIYTDGLTAKS